MRYVALAYCFLPLVAAALLARSLGTGAATAIVIGAGLASVAVGAMLRHWSIGPTKWRYVVSSWLMPWGGLLGGGTLELTAYAALLMWTFQGLAGAFGWAEPWLLVAVVVDAMALRWLAISVWARRGDRLQKRVVTRLSLLVVGLAVAGLGCAMCGYPLLGAAVAGGIPVLVASLFLVWLGMFVLLRPSRYN